MSRSARRFPLARPLRWALLGLVLAACGTSLPFIGDDAGESPGLDAATTTTPTQPPPAYDARPNEPDGGPVTDGGQDATDATVACVLVQDGSVVSGCMAMDVGFMATWNKISDAGCGPDASTYTSTQDPGVVCCTWSESVEAKGIPVPLVFDFDGGRLVVNGREMLPLNPSSGGTLYSRTVPYPEMTAQAADAALSILALSDASTDGASAFFKEWTERGAGRNGTGLNSITAIGFNRDGGSYVLTSREPHIANPDGVCPLSVAKYRWSGNSTTPTTVFRDAGSD